MRVFPAKNKVAAKTARIEKNFPTQKPPKTEATATRFDVSILELKIRRKKRAKLAAY